MLSIELIKFEVRTYFIECIGSQNNACIITYKSIWGLLIDFKEK